MNEHLSEDSESEELEDWLKQAPSRQLPVALRSRILAEMQTHEEAVAGSNEGIASFRYWAVRMAALIVLSLISWLLLSGPSTQNPHGAGGGSPRTAEQTPALTQMALMTQQLEREPVGEVIRLEGNPVRLVRQRQLETQTYLDPKTGAVVNVSIPKTQYQFVTTSIQ